MIARLGEDAPEGRWRARGEDEAFARAALELARGRLDASRGFGRFVRVGGLETYLKGGPLRGESRWRHGARALLLRRPLPRERELDNLTWLRARGFRAARPLGCAALLRRGLPRFQVLLTERVAAARDLAEALASADADERRRLARALGDLAGRLHAAGFVHRDLFVRNLLVGADGELWVLDAWRGGPGPGRRGPRADLRDLRRDLGERLDPAEHEELVAAYGAARA